MTLGFYNRMAALTALSHADLSYDSTSSDSTLVRASALELVVGSMLHHGRVDGSSKAVYMIKRRLVMLYVLL